MWGRPICIVCNQRINFFDEKVRYNKHWAHLTCVDGGIKCYIEN